MRVARCVLALAAAAALLPACHETVALSAVLASADRVELSWTSGSVDGFVVERAAGGGAFVPLAPLPGSARAWTDSAPPGGTLLEYRLQVRGFDGSLHPTSAARVVTPWAATCGGAGDEDALSLSVLPDGGLAVSGEGFPLTWGSYDAWILRLAPDGSILRQKAYGTPLGEWATYARPASNGDLLAVGACGWTPGQGDAWIARLAPDGAPRFQLALGGTRYDEALGVEETSDGGFVAAGYTWSQAGGGSDLWVARFDAAGALQWRYAYDTGRAEFSPGFSLQIRELTARNGWLVASAVEESPGGFWDAWIVELNPAGNVRRAARLGGPGMELPYMAVPLPDGGLILAAASSSFGSGDFDAWIVRLDRRWNPVWQRSFGGPRTDLALSIEPTRDGDFLVAGWTDSFGAGAEDLWILRLSGTDGSIVWQRTYGGPASEWAPMIWARETPDGGVAAAGATRSAGAGGSDLWVLKLARDGSIAFPPAGSFRTFPSAAFSLSTLASVIPLGAVRRDPGFAVSAYPGSVTDTSVAPRRQAP
jgi:hypothetical protein